MCTLGPWDRSTFNVYFKYQANRKRINFLPNNESWSDSWDVKIAMLRRWEWDSGDSSHWSLSVTRHQQVLSDTLTWPLIGRSQHPRPLIGRAWTWGHWQSYRNEDGPDTDSILWPASGVMTRVWPDMNMQSGATLTTSQASWELIKKMHDTYFYLHWLRCNSYIHSHGQSQGRQAAFRANESTAASLSANQRQVSPHISHNIE